MTDTRNKNVSLGDKPSEERAESMMRKKSKENLLVQEKELEKVRFRY